MGFLASGALEVISIFCCFVSEGSARRIFLISTAFVSCGYGRCGKDFAFHVCFHSNAYFYQLYLFLRGPTILRIDIKFTSKFYISPVFTRKCLIAIFQSLRLKSGGGTMTMTKIRQDNSTSWWVAEILKTHMIHTSLQKNTYYLILLTLISIFTEM